MQACLRFLTLYCSPIRIKQSAYGFGRADGDQANENVHDDREDVILGGPPLLCNWWANDQEHEAKKAENALENEPDSDSSNHDPHPVPWSHWLIIANVRPTRSR